MFHEPPREFLYSSYLIKVKFLDSIGTSKEGQGTGFVLDIGDKKPMIVTNRHLIDIDYRQSTPKYKDFRLSEFSITGRKKDDSSYTFKLHAGARFFFDRVIENDVVLIEPRMLIEGDAANDLNLHWHFDLDHLADDEVFQNTLLPYDEVVFSGFPEQHDKLSNRPILRSGRISSDPKFDYSFSGNFEGNRIAYEAFSSEGASGSPVFAVARGATTIPDSRKAFLVGINAGHIKEQGGLGGHTGISYFYKSTVISRIINEQILVSTNP